MRKCVSPMLSILLAGCSGLTSSPQRDASSAPVPVVYDDGELPWSDAVLANQERSIELGEAALMNQAALMDAIRSTEPTDPAAEKHWQDIAGMCDDGTLTTTGDLFAVVDRLVSQGVLGDVRRIQSLRGHDEPITRQIVATLTAAQPPPVDPEPESESPFPSDRIRVLISLEKTTAQPEYMQELTFWLLTNLGNDWRVVDNDREPGDFTDDAPWVAGAVESLPDGDDEHWLLVASPDGGFSGPLESLEQVRGVVEGMR